MPTASLMNCDVLEPSSPTTARFPLSSISVPAVRAQPGIWVVGGAAKDCQELGVEDRSGELRVGCKAVLGLRKYPQFRETQTDFICTLQSSCVRLLPVFHLKCSVATCVPGNWPCPELGPYLVPLSNLDWVSRCPVP